MFRSTAQGRIPGTRPQGRHARRDDDQRRPPDHHAHAPLQTGDPVRPTSSAPVRPTLSRWLGRSPRALVRRADLALPGRPRRRTRRSSTRRSWTSCAARRRAGIARRSSTSCARRSSCESTSPSNGCTCSGTWTCRTLRCVFAACMCVCFVRVAHFPGQAAGQGPSTLLLCFGSSAQHARLGHCCLCAHACTVVRDF